jgi:hypothetical protein
MLAASLLSYIVIEKPLRIINWRPSLVVVVLFLIPTLMVLGCGVVLLSAQNSSLSLQKQPLSSLNGTSLNKTSTV